MSKKVLSLLLVCSASFSAAYGHTRAASRKSHQATIARLADALADDAADLSIISLGEEAAAVLVTPAEDGMPEAAVLIDPTAEPVVVIPVEEIVVAPAPEEGGSLAQEEIQASIGEPAAPLEIVDTPVAPQPKPDIPVEEQVVIALPIVDFVESAPAAEEVVAAPAIEVAPAPIIAPATPEISVPVVVPSIPAPVVETPVVPVVVAPSLPAVVEPVVVAPPAAPTPTSPVVAPVAPAPAKGTLGYTTKNLEATRHITSIMLLLTPAARVINRNYLDCNSEAVKTLIDQTYKLSAAALGNDTMAARVARALSKIDAVAPRGDRSWDAAHLKNAAIEAAAAVLAEVALKTSGRGIARLLPRDQQRIMRRLVAATSGAAIETTVEAAAAAIQRANELPTRPTTLGKNKTLRGGAREAFVEKLLTNLTYQLLGEIILAGASDVEQRDYLADLKAVVTSAKREMQGRI